MFESLLRGMCRRLANRGLIIGALIAALLAGMGIVSQAKPKGDKRNDADGMHVFRYETFNDERFWTDTLRMHEVIQQALDPITALNLGLKVDADALPDAVAAAILSGEVDLEDPATTLTLLELDAVVGVVGTVSNVNGKRTLSRVGITCALCHSTIDDSVAPGIGRRLDGWANHDLDPGAIIALSPAISPQAKAIYNSWGKGKYDPRFNIDGRSTPLVIPPAYGLDGVDAATYTADGDISYWNDYVAVTQMGGQGIFIDPRLGLHIVRTPDRVQPVLEPLRHYQFSLPVPVPPPGSFDPKLVKMGSKLFHGVARCAECHLPPFYTDVNEGILHEPQEVGQDPAYAERSATGKYRTTPLRALWQHAPYFHDGSAQTLQDVVDHYDSHFDLELDDAQKQALVEFLKSL